MKMKKNVIDKWYEKALVIVAITIIGLLVGCAAFQKGMTPAWIEKEAITYITDANIPCDIPRLWWTSLADAETVDKLLDYSHDQRQILLNRASEDDRAWYSLVKNQHQEHRQDSIALQQELFTPQGSVGLMVTTGLGALVGAMAFQRPQDKREIDVLKNGKA